MCLSDSPKSLRFYAGALRHKYPDTKSFELLMAYPALRAVAYFGELPDEKVELFPRQDSFQGFPKLPTELRRMIWQYNIEPVSFDLLTFVDFIEEDDRVRPFLFWENNIVRYRELPSAFCASLEAQFECRHFCPRFVFGHIIFRLSKDLDTLRIHTATLRQLSLYKLQHSAEVAFDQSGFRDVKRIEIAMQGLLEIHELFDPAQKDGARKFLDLFRKVQELHLQWRGPLIRQHITETRGWGDINGFNKARDLILGHFKTMVARGICKRVPILTIAKRYQHRKSSERIWPSIKSMFERAEMG